MIFIACRAGSMLLQYGSRPPSASRHPKCLRITGGDAPRCGGSMTYGVPSDKLAFSLPAAMAASEDGTYVHKRTMVVKRGSLATLPSLILYSSCPAALENVGRSRRNCFGETKYPSYGPVRRISASRLPAMISVALSGERPQNPRSDWLSLTKKWSSWPARSRMNPRLDRPSVSRPTRQPSVAACLLKATQQALQCGVSCGSARHATAPPCG